MPDLRDDTRLTVGWREWVSLPVLDVDAIKAKVDTGARTSSLHAFDLEIEDGPDGRRLARFSIHPLQRTDVPEVSVELPVVEERRVRSSNGDVEDRPVVVTDVVLGGERFEIEITLTNRDEMGFRMLLGRSALRDRAVVDPSGSYLTGLTPAAREAKRRTPPANPGD